MIIIVSSPFINKSLNINDYEYADSLAETLGIKLHIPKYRVNIKDEDLEKSVLEYDIFGRVTPNGKKKITFENYVQSYFMTKTKKVCFVLWTKHGRNVIMV